MTASMVDAFNAASNGYSSDRVVADPELNERFIAECRQRGLRDSAVDLNHALLNLRKKGALAGRPRAKRTNFPDEDEYRFAAEIAVRFIERRDSVSLDSIICDPGTVAEFDKVAERIAPGYSPLQYRWAALNIRKAKGLHLALRAAPSDPIHSLRRGWSRSGGRTPGRGAARKPGLLLGSGD